MFINVELRGRFIPMMAPIGTAGYAIKLDGDAASIIFVVIKPEETGLGALNRVRKSNSTLTWIPVAARPEHQRAGTDVKEGFIAYDFEYNGESWIPKTTDLSNFFELMTRLSGLPSKAPDSSYTTLEEWSKKQTKQAA